MTEMPSHPLDPGLTLRDGVPVSMRFDDVYFSRENGLAETGHVFLEGCGLPGAWRGTASRSFTIAETGFGTGLNFLAAWDLWRRHRPAGGVLHYVAVEGFPIPRRRLAETLSAFPGLATLAARLIERYPDGCPGLHRIWFAEDRVCLTLAIGEAEEALSGLEARVDAWFLDGFAPAKNPSMWRDAVLREVSRLSRPGTCLASFTAAGSVRRGLGAVGFDVEKRPGYGRKRDCIAARFVGAVAVNETEPWYAPPPPMAPERAAVIGAGVGGAALVGVLRRRGIGVDWLDRHGRPAAEASGNPAGLMMARPSLAGDAIGAVNAAAFRYAVAQAEALDLPFHGDGVIELATSADGLGRFEALADADALSGVSAELVDAGAAGEIAGVPVERPALWHRSGGWVRPRDWTAALSGDPGPRRADIRAIRRSGAGWALTGEADIRVADADAVFVSSAIGSRMLLADSLLPLQAIRGQVTRLGETGVSRRLRACLAYGGYLSPAMPGGHVTGATYTHDGFEAGRWPVAVRGEDHARILGTMPACVARLFGDAPSVLGGRAAVRAATPDRQPVAGPVCAADDLAAAYGHLRNDAKRVAGGPPPYLAGLYALTGLGSRGLVTAPLMAELVVSQMLGEPWPVTRAVAAAVHPNRFAIRALSRRQL